MAGDLYTPMELTFRIARLYLNILADEAAAVVTRNVEKHLLDRRLDVDCATSQIRLRVDDPFRPVHHAIQHIKGEVSFEARGKKHELTDSDGSAQETPESLVHQTSLFFARLWSIMERNVFGAEGKKPNGVPKNAHEVSSEEEMVRAAEKALMANLDFNGMLKGYMDLEDAVQAAHKLGESKHRLWLEVLNRGLLLDPSADEIAVADAAEGATKHLLDLVFMMLEGILKIQEDGGVVAGRFHLYKSAKEGVTIPVWHIRENFSVLPPVYPDRFMPNKQINRLTALLVKLNVYVSIVPRTQAHCNLWYALISQFNSSLCR